MSSNIVQQPQTSGKVILNTSHGELDIELWCKECPKACKNFIQLCLEGGYNNTIFHRLIPNFMIQGGDPTGTGDGGKSIYGGPFQDEFHQRLKFQQRGILAMANNKANDNGSQFFITFDSCGWLDKKHTIFGKVVGNTIYNLMLMNSIDTDSEDRPITDIKIIDTKVIDNPFNDIIIRKNIEPVINQNIKNDKVTVNEQIIKKKNPNTRFLLSFDQDESDQEKDQNDQIKKGIVNSHDVLHNDPKLKQQPVISKEELDQKKLKRQEQENKINDLKNHLRQPNDIDNQFEVVKKRRYNEQDQKISLENLVENKKDLQLLNRPLIKQNDGRVKIDFDYNSETSSTSSSSDEFETEDQRIQRQKQKEQYDSLKAEVLQFKKSNLGTYSEQRNENIEHEKKLLSNLEKQRLKYVKNKQQQKHDTDLQTKLNDFRAKLNSNESKDQWINNKLKFHVDSQNAFNTQELKQKVQDFSYDGKIGNNEKIPVKIKSNINELIKMAE